MARRKKKPAKPRKLISDAKLSGLFYSVDPSSGGGTSNPAIAIWRNGELEEVREIRLPKVILERRLSALLSTLLEMEEPDIWAIEEVPPYIRTKYGSTVNFSLHKSIGLFQAVWGHLKMIKIPVMAWKPYVKEVTNYEKTDAFDAVLIGYTALREGGINVDLSQLSISEPEK